MGIEIKEWDKRVYPKMAMEYLETYRGTCEYFYLAANKFSKSTLELKDIGLFDLGRMKVIKNPGYLYPDVEFRANLMKRIKITSRCCQMPWMIHSRGRFWSFRSHYYTEGTGVKSMLIIGILFHEVVFGYRGDQHEGSSI